MCAHGCFTCVARTSSKCLPCAPVMASLSISSAPGRIIDIPTSGGGGEGGSSLISELCEGSYAFNFVWYESVGKGDYSNFEIWAGISRWQFPLNPNKSIQLSPRSFASDRERERHVHFMLQTNWHSHSRAKVIRRERFCTHTCLSYCACFGGIACMHHFTYVPTLIAKLRDGEIGRPHASITLGPELY